MRIGIVGGRLQGLEAVYLAQEAGFETALIDRNPAVPARPLAVEFFQQDLLHEERAVKKVLKQCDLVVPATENFQALQRLDAMARKCDVPIALDLPSYCVTSSKLRSNELFARAGIPFPLPWPDCGFPVIVKPSDRSGSEGVRRALDRVRLDAALAALQGEAVVQQYVEGPSYSLEVLAHRGAGRGLQVTELAFDAGYDCKRVVAGPTVGADVAAGLCDIGERIAQALQLCGIMDVEVIDTGDALQVLEIDARLPSQTPTAVYHSSGRNMVKLLAEYWVGGTLPAPPEAREARRGVVYEHLRFRDGLLEVAGEHVLSEAQGLGTYQGLFSAEVLISNFARSSRNWVATAVFTGDTEDRAWATRNRGIDQIRETFGARELLDPSPNP